MRTLSAVAFAATFTMVGAASAATIDYTAGIGLTPTPYTTAAGAVQLKQFNPGTDGIPFDAFLTGVLIEFDSSIDANYTFNCAISFTPICTANPVLLSGNYITANTSLTGPGLAVALNLNPSGGALGTITLPTDETSSGAGLSTFFVSGITGSDSGSVNPGLAGFTGAGLLNYIIQGTGGRIDSLTGFANSGANVSSNANVMITYTYDVPPPPPPPTEVIPVPAALPLLASALGLFGMMRLRRKA